MRENLKTMRIASGLTALEMAQLADTTEARIYAFERGRNRPRVNEAIMIAAVFGVSAAELFPDMAEKLLYR